MKGSNMSPGAVPSDSGPGRSAARLDEIDRAIIAALLGDGRMSIRALAEHVHISRANAYTRVARLLDEEVITGFAARINPGRAGLGTTAYVMLTIEQDTWRAVAARLREVPSIERFSLVGGDFDVLVLVRTHDNDALRHVVLDLMQAIPGVRATRTWLVFDECAGAGPDWTRP